MKSRDISSLIDLLRTAQAEKEEYKQWLANANVQLANQSHTINTQSNTIVSLEKLLAHQLQLPVAGE